MNTPTRPIDFDLASVAAEIESRLAGLIPADLDLSTQAGVDRLEEILVAEAREHCAALVAAWQEGEAGATGPDAAGV